MALDKSRTQSFARFFIKGMPVSVKEFQPGTSFFNNKMRESLQQRDSRIIRDTAAKNGLIFYLASQNCGREELR